MNIFESEMKLGPISKIAQFQKFQILSYGQQNFEKFVKTFDEIFKILLILFFVNITPIKD